MFMHVIEKPWIQWLNRISSVRYTEVLPGHARVYKSLPIIGVFEFEYWRNSERGWLTIGILYLVIATLATPPGT